MIERISKKVLRVRTQRTNGFGHRAESINVVDDVAVVSTEEFERLLAENVPTGHWGYGMNEGAPKDGLVEFIGKSGVRYLADMTGPGTVCKYADEATCPPDPATEAEVVAE